MDLFILFFNILTVIVGGFSALVIVATVYQFSQLTPYQQYLADISGILKYIIILLVCIAWWIALIFV